jgi:proton-translocating NADH-quinone oxidoreductase chain M
VSLPLLSTVLLLPIIGALIILAIPARKEQAIKFLAFACAFLVLILVIVIFANFDFKVKSFQFVEKVAWIIDIGASYHLGVDGISLPLLLVVTLITCFSIIASWDLKVRSKTYFAMMLMAEAGIIGVLVSLDLLLFIFFWELVLIPSYFLIALWGGEKGEYAALKFILYTLTGGVILFISILLLYFESGLTTFDLVKLSQISLPFGVQWLIFLGLFIGLAVKVPFVPVHTWLPDAYGEAHLPVAALLAGGMAKLAPYGFLRIGLGLLGEAMQSFGPLIVILGIINIVFGAFCAMSQKNLKRLVAYSSLSHMGFIMIGIGTATVLGLAGAVFQMFSHGLIIALLFLLLAVIGERTGSLELPELGRLFERSALSATLFVFGALAALGLPGLSGFIGEFLILGGLATYLPVLLIFVAAGVILTAGYFLLAIKQVCLAEVGEGEPLPSISIRDGVYLGTLAVAIVFFGVYPLPLMQPIMRSIAGLVF